MTHMEVSQTDRGFSYANFTDVGGNECSLQESSNAMQACVWLGSNKIGLQHFKAEWGGWKSVTEPDEVNSMTEHYVANNRMQLNQDQVKQLLPALQYFAEHGILPFNTE